MAEGAEAVALALKIMKGVLWRNGRDVCRKPTREPRAGDLTEPAQHLVRDRGAHDVAVYQASVTMEGGTLPSPSAVNQPPIRGAGGLHDRLGEGRMGVDRAGHLVVAALELVGVHELLDQSAALTETM